MMLYVILLLVIAWGGVWWIAPKSHVVFAGVEADAIPSPPMTGRWISAGLAQDRNGKTIDVRGKFLGVVRGNSLENKIPNGSRFIADHVAGKNDHSLSPGDLVVVKEIDFDSESARFCYCLRQIESIADGKVTYVQNTHKYLPDEMDRFKERVAARVTHIFGPGSFKRVQN